jgi:hypothetical protein
MRKNWFSANVTRACSSSAVSSILIFFMVQSTTRYWPAFLGTNPDIDFPHKR